jgi:hypothetical protein
LQTSNRSASSIENDTQHPATIGYGNLFITLILKDCNHGEDFGYALRAVSGRRKSALNFFTFQTAHDVAKPQRRLF